MKKYKRYATNNLLEKIKKNPKALKDPRSGDNLYEVVEALRKEREEFREKYEKPLKDFICMEIKSSGG